jgi:hypothetical protein
MNEQDIEARNYSFCQAFYDDATVSGGYREETFLVGTPAKPEARERAAIYAVARWGEPRELHIYPRDYVAQARALFAQGRYEQADPSAPRSDHTRRDERDVVGDKKMRPDGTVHEQPYGRRTERWPRPATPAVVSPC